MKGIEGDTGVERREKNCEKVEMRRDRSRTEMMRKQMSNREYLEVKIANKCDSKVDEIRNIEWLQSD